MITKLNLNKRRISLSLLTLIVFITNFNLLHSMDNEAESVNARIVKLKTQANQISELVVQQQREIIANLHHRKDLQDTLKLILAKLVREVKNQSRKNGELPSSIDLIKRGPSDGGGTVERDELAEGWAQAEQSLSRQVSQQTLPEILRAIKPRDVEEHVTKKLILAVARDHLEGIDGAAYDLELLYDRSIVLLRDQLLNIEARAREDRVEGASASKTRRISSDLAASATPVDRNRETVKANIIATIHHRDETLRNKRVMMYKSLDKNLYDLVSKINQNSAIGAIFTSSDSLPQNLAIGAISEDLNDLRKYFEDECRDVYALIIQNLNISQQNLNISQRSSLIYIEGSYCLHTPLVTPVTTKLEAMQVNYKRNFMKFFNKTFSGKGISFSEIEEKRILQHEVGDLMQEKKVDLKEDISFVDDSSPFERELLKHALSDGIRYLKSKGISFTNTSASELMNLTLL